MSEEQNLINKADGEAMKSFRKESKTSQQAVADKGKVSRKTVVESESGNSTMQASTKRKMLRGNSVTAEEFRERKDELAKAKKNGETEKGEGK